MRAARLAPLLVLVGCHGHPPAAPSDAALAQAAHSGREALQFDHPGQAVTQYQRALQLALARDDVAAVGDLGYDLAVAQIAGNQPAAALETTRRTRTALRARGGAGFAELDLAQAAALYHLGQDLPADTLAAAAQADAADPATVIQAITLRGLIADTRGNTGGLAALVAALGEPKHPTPQWQVSHDTLSARLDLRRGDFGAAVASAQSAAAVQRQQLRYADMAQSLALAARAAAAGGRLSEAADLYLQAGESAAARGDAPHATAWLEQAQAPGADIATLQQASRTLSRVRTSRPSGRGR